MARRSFLCFFLSSFPFKLFARTGGVRCADTQISDTGNGQLWHGSGDVQHGQMARFTHIRNLIWPKREA